MSFFLTLVRGKYIQIKVVVGVTTYCFKVSGKRSNKHYMARSNNYYFPTDGPEAMNK